MLAFIVCLCAGLTVWFTLMVCDWGFDPCDDAERPL